MNKTFLYRVATDLMYQSDRILKAFSLHFLYIRILEWRFLNLIRQLIHADLLAALWRKGNFIMVKVNKLSLLLVYRYGIVKAYEKKKLDNNTT